MKKIFFVMTILFLFYFVGTNAVSVFSYSENSNTEVIGEDISNDVYNSYNITYIGHMYNYDDSDDYLYVEFVNDCYGIYWKNTLELLEYVENSSINFYVNLENEKIYFFGPQQYYLKTEKEYVNILDNSIVYLSNEEIKLYADNVRKIFGVENEFNFDEVSLNTFFNNQEKLHKSNGTDGGIKSFDDSLATYIDNYNYFLNNPYYGKNEHGTCSSVAAQLILSYNNYYNDRRIISPEYLFGGWNKNGDGDYFNELNYFNPQNSLYVCENFEDMTGFLLGSNSDYYNHIISIIDPLSIFCIDTEVDGVTKHTYLGATESQKSTGLDTLLNENLDTEEYSVTLYSNGLLNQPISSLGIINEIDCNRPVIVCMSSKLGAFDHAAVAYGYLEYTLPNTNEKSMGYIVEYGWSYHSNVSNPQTIKTWINSSWVDAYITVETKHMHNYDIDTGKNYNNIKREVICSECGHRKLKDLYTIINDTIISINYPLSGDIVIPNTVTSIGESAFEGCTNLENIILPSSLETIGSNAFKNCNKITSITIPHTVTSIGNSAFEGCTNLENIILPSSLKTIGSGAFSGCSSLTSIEIPDSVTSIGSYAFKNCNKITSITIPHTVTSIGNSAFEGSTNITDLTIPYLDTYIGELFGLSSYIVHSTQLFKLNNITITGGSNIPDYAFYGMSALNEINLPSNILTIGNYAFYNCSGIDSFNLTNSLITIGSNAFSGCSSLRNVTLPSSVTSIGNNAFAWCDELTSIIISNSVETIGNNAFAWCSKLEGIIIPDSVETVGNGAFKGCNNLESIEFKKETHPITSIGVDVFNNCSELENIIVPMSKILKYKNANNWSNYSSKISYSGTMDELLVNCYGTSSYEKELAAANTIVCKLEVDCIQEYNIICSTTEEVVVYLYDSNMELSGIYPTYSNSNHTATFITELPLGIYYLEISYSDYQKSGSISTTISPSNGSIHHTKTTGMTSILPHLHKVSNNTYKAQFSFTPTYKTGLHKLSLSGTTSSGSNIVFGSGSISVYDNLSKITPMYQYSMLGLDNLAVSGGKEILVYLEKNETYYIDVTLSSNQYSALNLQILTYFNCEIGAADLPPYDISIMSNNKSYGSDLCEFILHDAMDFTVTIEGLTEGKFIIYQEVINEEGIISYSLVKEESFTGDFTDSFSLEAGSYYIGYIDASTSNDMNYDIMRIVVDC